MLSRDQQKCSPAISAAAVPRATPPRRLPGSSGRITSIAYPGVCLIHPADTIEIRIRAPYPSQLQVLINGTALQDVTPSGSTLPQPDDPGYFKYTVQQLDGYAPKLGPPPDGLNWFFWMVDIKLPKEFRYASRVTRVPPFTLTLRDISNDPGLTGTQRQAPDLNLAIAGFPVSLDQFAPSRVFSSGENSKDDTDIVHRARATLGIVARDVTVAGWIEPIPPQNGGNLSRNDHPFSPPRSEDWHFDLWLDPDFIQRNYAQTTPPQ